MFDHKQRKKRQAATAGEAISIKVIFINILPEQISWHGLCDG
jgi:hypothetical protein